MKNTGILKRISKELQVVKAKKERADKVLEAVESAMFILQSNAFEPSEKGAGWANTDDAEREASDLLIDTLERLLN